MLLSTLVATSSAVGSTRARKVKVQSLAALLREMDADEIEPAVGFLIGVPRQGRIGVGWRTASSVEVDHAAEPTITIGELDGVLSAIEATTGPGSGGARQALLADLFERATQAEADFVRRLLTGELRQGALAGVMTDAVAKSAEVPLEVVRRAAMLSGDLGRTAELALTGGREALEEVALTVLHPIEPMLASTATDVADALARTGPASVEWKLDGIRVQVHRAGDEVRIYTRNLNEITDRLPGLVAIARSIPARSAVLDGEVLGVAEDERPRAFQDTMSAVSRGSGVHPEAMLFVRFFDVLHVDGVDLIDEPLAVRQQHLDQQVGDLAVPRVHTSDADAARAALDGALAAGHEGVVVKALDSAYDAGRRGGAWRKVKPVHTFDLVVLAAEWGHGRRQGWLSNLHLGARDPDGGFVMVGKTFKGLTDELLTWQTAALLDREVSREGIVVHVRPELVVETALDGVQTSTRYPGGVALRFARVLRYRDDKSPDEVDLLADLQAMRLGVTRSP